MWRMHDGDRVLTEAEWAVFRIGLDDLRAQVETEIRDQADGTDTGTPVFDRLTPEQKLALLADVARAVREPGVPIPRHTAANEGALYAVFATFRDRLRLEIEAGGPGDTGLRQCLLAAVAGPGDRPEAVPRLTSRKWGRWCELHECLVERVLWDNDFAMGDQFLDLPPEVSRAALAGMKISTDYYLDVPAEPGGKGLILARQALARLIGLPVPDDRGHYAALFDLYHGLFVGPATPAEVRAWADAPWVEEIGQTDPGCDCDYRTWEREYAASVPAAPFRLAAPGPGDAGELPGGLRVEAAGGGWVVRDAEGAYWCEVVGNGWKDAPDADMPALTFPTEAAARSAYAQAARLYADREKRHAAAAERLGIA